MRCYSCGWDLFFSPTKFKIVKSLKLVPFFPSVPFKDGHVEGIHIDKVGQPCKSAQRNPSTPRSVLAFRITDQRSQIRLHTTTIAYSLVLHLFPLYNHESQAMLTFATLPVSSNSVTDIDFTPSS
jgi:hypothetical protein